MARDGIANFELGQIIMILVGCTLLFLAIRKGFEPLLLLPIGFGAVLANIPNAGFTEPGGLLYYVYHIGIESGVFPLLIFMGVGAMTDFGALIANPKTLWLGAAAQLGILLPCLVPFCSTLYRAWNSLWLMPRRLQSLVERMVQRPFSLPASYRRICSGQLRSLRIAIWRWFRLFNHRS